MTVTDTPRADPRLGRVLSGQYRLDRLLGEGGMGAVYRGEQLSVGRPVAIKLIAGKVAENPECVRRFRREAEAMAKLRHPNTVRLYDFGVTEADSAHPELFMVMELLDGRDLAEQLALSGRLPPGEALSITRQVLEALTEAHALGIVHRDLKPANIFLSQMYGGRTLAKVMDFGIAGIEQTGAATKLTMTGAVMGTPAYMSPEQAQGKLVDARSDLYSLGVMLFEMLVGRPPFEADSAVSLLLAQVSTPPPRLRDVTPELPDAERLSTLLDALLDKRPEGRPASAEAAIALVDDVAKSLDTLSALPRASGSSSPAAQPKHDVWAAQAQPTLDSPSITTQRVPVHVGDKRGRALLIAGGSIALVAAGIALWPRATIPPPPLPQTEVRAGAPSSGSDTSLYSVHITSKPPAASVELSGVEIGKTPYTLQYRRPTTLRLVLAGYAPAQLDVDERSEPNRVVELEPLVAEKRGARLSKTDRAQGPEPSHVATTTAPPQSAAAATPTVVAAPEPKAAASSPRPAQQSTPSAALPPPSWLSKVPVLSTLTARERREAMLRRGPPYPSVAAAKSAYRAGRLNKVDYEDTIWVLKTQRSNRINSEKLNYKEGRISRDEYDRRVKRIDAAYRG